jgi:hypothetical protein
MSEEKDRLREGKEEVRRGRADLLRGVAREAVGTTCNNTHCTHCARGPRCTSNTFNRRLNTVNEAPAVWGRGNDHDGNIRIASILSLLVRNRDGTWNKLGLIIP